MSIKSRYPAVVGSGLCLLLLALPLAAKVEVEARLEPTLIGAGQHLTLTVEARIEGGIDLEIEPHFSLDNLEIVGGPSQSQQVSFVNGRVSRSQTLSWTLRAVEVGSARVQNLRLSVNEETFDLPEQVAEVQEEAVGQLDTIDPYGRPRRFADPFEDFFDPLRRRRRSVSQAEPKLFLRAEVTPKSPYVGQQVLYSLLLFTQADIGAVNPDKMPDFAGLWSVDIEQPQRPKSVMTEVQGERYGRVVLLQKALFPLRAGELQLEPVEARLIAKIPDYSWMGVVGSFDKEFSLRSNAVTLDVQPIPEAPDGFQGAVGDFTLTADLEPREILVGEAATLTVTLSGRGHVEGLPEPELPALDGIRVFPPERSGGNRAAGTTIQGTKTWSYVLVPERAGVWEIPIAEYAYFDPHKGEHRSTGGEAKVLVARRPKTDLAEGAAPPRVTDAETTGDRPAERDSDDSPLPDSRWLVVIPALVLIVVLVPAARRFAERRRATGSLRRHLEDAAVLDKPRAAAHRIEEAWRTFLSERWSLSPSLAPGEWPGKLAAAGVSATAVTELTRLVEDLHYLRYAPELSDYDNLRAELINRSLHLARLLS